MVFPKRLLLVFTPDGTPSVDPTAWRRLEAAGHGDGFTLHSIHSPLEPFKSKIVMPWGIKMSAAAPARSTRSAWRGCGRAPRCTSPAGDANFDGGNGQRTGWGGGPSVDQIMARRNGPNSPYQRAATDAMQETKFRTLELGVQCAEPHSMHRMIYKADNQPIHPEINPLAAFNRLFPTGSATPPPPSATAAATARKRAQLDALMSQVEKLRGRVGSEEMPKIEAHLGGLRTLSTRLNAPTTTVGCTPPTTAPAASMVRYENSATFRADATAMMDLAVHAFACDLTRIASVQLSRGFSNIVHSWVGATQGHHTISHLSGDNTTQLQDIDRWYATQFAYLLGKLDAVKEGNGTMLDNTLVVWGREMGTTSHKMQPVNLILAGGARGALPTGRFLDRNREPHAKLLVSIAA